jgi:predicted DNA-binding transcriptional regulator AlpA
MTPHLFGIAHAPAALPVWQTILDDLAHPPAREVARVLGISVRTVYRYNGTGSAPRVVLLALFWLTRWGRSAVHTQATNDALMACGLVAGLNRRIAELERQLAHVQSIGAYGSQNAPILDSPGTPLDARVGWGPVLREGEALGYGVQPHGSSPVDVRQPLPTAPSVASSTPPTGTWPGGDGLDAGERLAAASGRDIEPRPRPAGGRRRRPA